jgi:hypothetical protein
MEELVRTAASVTLAAALIGICAMIGRLRSTRPVSPSLALVARLGVPPGQPAVIYVGAGAASATLSAGSAGGGHVIVHRLPVVEPELVRALDIPSLPATIVIGRDHSVRAIHDGVTEVDRISELLA